MKGVVGRVCNSISSGEVSSVYPLAKGMLCCVLFFLSCRKWGGCLSGVVGLC